MKPHPRIRKTIKWGGAAVTVLLVVVWIGSGWRDVAVWRGSRYARIACGYFEVVNEPDEPVGVGGGAQPVADAPNWFWWVFEYRPGFFGRVEGGVAISLWCPAAALLLVTATAWRLDTLARRRARLNLCPKCGYDRAGLVAGAVCPECGHPAA